ncbi:hypothetical protein ACFSQJ_19505 [Croceitalea marina]|uniref:Poly(3-hydroxyalkanoate) polymerase subunit PhaE n=1 Tax=Croceitalea marina TaxID=1775166 RepID=A0ABW5N0S3_9FLAO
MATQEELVKRWDGFLFKIEERFNDSLRYAEEACKEQLVETDYEYQTVMRSWGGMKAQMYSLIEKIDETWDAKVGPAMEAVGDFASDESDKAYDLRHKLIDALEKFQRKLEGELSQLFYDHAIQIADKKAQCAQCDADIEIQKNIFRAQYITCTYCNAVNTIEPETKFVKIGWGIVDNIAAMRMNKGFEKMQRAVNAIQEYRGKAPEAYWSTYEDAYFAYWESFFKERINLNADAADRLEQDMERKRQEFENYKEIQTK